MTAYVGRTARVTELAGTDERGCPGVHVDADGGEWFWRLRDLSLADGGDEGTSYPRGMASDHGRVSPAPSAPAPPAEGDRRVPQACGLTDSTARFDPVSVDTEVELGRHRPVDGEANWAEEMDAYVGQRARVTELVGVDRQGCPLIRVDLDGAVWYWRLRDVRLP